MQVELTLKNYRCFSDARPARFLVRDGFTAFLGVNNSGKSSLLKFFYEFRKLFETLSNLNQELDGPVKGTPRAFPLQGTHVPAEVFCKNNNRNLEIRLTFHGLSAATDDSGIPFLRQIAITLPRDQNTFTLHVEHPLGGSHPRPESLNFNGPTLRMRDQPWVHCEPLQDACRALASTLYIGPFRNAINVGGKTDYFDIKIGQAFITEWKINKAGPVPSINETVARLTTEIGNLFGFESLEINAGPSDEILKFLVNSQSFTDMEMGSGLVQFLLVLAAAALKQPAFILIDEPELNLHPSLQLDFLTTLGAYARQGVLFATHSYGLARARAQQVYTVRYDRVTGSDVQPLESKPPLAELLGELSFSAYRELGFDKVLLVEGPTEVLAMQQFLRMYSKDHEILLLPLGGSSLISGNRELELREVLRITEHVYALIDSERDHEGAALAADRQAFVTTCSNVGISCRVLDRRATENYLTDTAVKTVKGPKYRALAPYEKLKAVNPAWSKDENWRIARVMTDQDLKNTDLGVFLESL